MAERQKEIFYFQNLIDEVSNKFDRMNLRVNNKLSVDEFEQKLALKASQNQVDSLNK